MSIVNFCRVVPDGVLVFFPSYQVMDSCLNYWQICRPGGGGNASSSASNPNTNAQTVFQMIQAIKIPVIEPKNKGELAVAMERYEKIIQDPRESRGAVFFAVCRGKVSEGLDFSDAKGRAVIVTGIPYPPFKDPKIILKKQYLQNQKQGSNFLSGADWYNQQASRAVNQALGRVIRHRNDFGAILLCDERFGNPGTINQLSKWLRGRVNVAASFGQVQGSLARFFKDKPKNCKQAPIEASTSTASNISMNAMNNSSANSYNMRNELQMQKFKINQVPFSADSPVQKHQNLAEMFKLSSSSSSSTKPSSSSTTKKFNWFNSKPSEETAPKVPITADKQKKAQDYLELVKASLPKDQFRNFMGLLKMYRANQISIDKLLTDLVELVSVSSVSNSNALLEGFEAFVPSKHRALFEGVLNDFRSKTQSNQKDKEKEKGVEDDECLNDFSLNGKRKLHSDFIGKRPQIPIEPVSLKRSIAASSELNSTPEKVISNAFKQHENCPICKDALNDPFKAKCNHVACFECWSAWLTRTLECPLCRQRTRISQLRRISDSDENNSMPSSENLHKIS